MNEKDGNNQEKERRLIACAFQASSPMRTWASAML